MLNTSHEVSLERIVLLHGYAAHRVLMWPLARRLRARGFVTINWGYSSIRRSIPEIAKLFEDLLARLDDAPDGGPIHLVGHSMGSIIIRTALAARWPTKLGRIVMIAPPNRGSCFADLLAPAFGWFSPPLRELRRAPDSFVNRLSDHCTANAEVGIVRARWDWIVRPEDTHLPGVRDTIVLNGTHSSVLWKKEAARVVSNFLRSGCFERDEGAQ